MFVSAQCLLQPGVSRLKYEKAFFCCGYGQIVLLHMFGSSGRHDVLTSILASYQPGSRRFPAEMPLAQRVERILLSEFAVHLQGGTELGLGEIRILSSSECVIPGSTSCCYINLAPISQRSQQVAMPKVVYELMMQQLSRMEALQNRNESYKQQLAELRLEHESLRLNLKYMAKRIPIAVKRRILMIPGQLKAAWKKLLHK